MTLQSIEGKRWKKDSGENHPFWKGNRVNKRSPLHEWIRSHTKMPELCEMCNKVPPYDLANISGKYLRDLNDWQWLCRKCHMNSDGRMRNLKNGHESRVDMSIRLCSLCDTDETRINKFGRPIWRYLDNNIICCRCYDRLYDINRSRNRSRK